MPDNRQSNYTKVRYIDIDNTKYVEDGEETDKILSKLKAYSSQRLPALEEDMSHAIEVLKLFQINTLDVFHGTDNYDSNKFIVGESYSRKELRRRFEISDETINTGVFIRKEANSIWIFVTQEKEADRTQYEDKLEGDLLSWQGQTQKRTDNAIIYHEFNTMEICLFFRKTKRDREDFSFIYEGTFKYVSHTSSGDNIPSDFILRRSIEETKTISQQFDEIKTSPLHLDLSDSRERTYGIRTIRPQQAQFKKDLVKAYKGKCAITGCDTPQVLEAAHIVPHRGRQTDVAQNGILLRADIHKLFDAGLLAIEPSGELSIHLAPKFGTVFIKTSLGKN